MTAQALFTWLATNDVDMATVRQIDLDTTSVRLSGLADLVRLVGKPERTPDGDHWSIWSGTRDGIRFWTRTHILGAL